jgi:methionyl-tRNA synthetase
MSHFYVTTPLYYVNDKPHVGHAYTTIAADVIARWHTLIGNQVHFLTGTDEHGQKVFEAAQKRGLEPKEHVDAMVKPFQELWKKLNIKHHDFIRTTEERHTRVVRAVLQKLFEQDDIYEDYYEGWYSTSEERFWTEKDLVDGMCPASGLPVQWLKEKNYFFKMSKYADQLRTHIRENPNFIRPESRKNEVEGYLKKDVGDLCISRPSERLPWGIPLPFDEKYVTYVWFDALLNYITALGYHPNGSSDFFNQVWPANFQLVGKDILTTHSVYWSTMLFAIGLQPTKCLYAHGWWTVEGKKMSKSLGNVVDPNLLVENYGEDPVRYFLLRQIPFGGDGNFSHDDFLSRYNSDLANGLGNLAQRSLGLLQNSLDGKIPKRGTPTTRDNQLEENAKICVEQFRKKMEKLDFFHAIESVSHLIQQGNKYIQEEQPWALVKQNKTERCGQVMRNALEVCRIVGWLLSPIMPTKCKQLLSQLGVTNSNNLDNFEGLTEGYTTEKSKPLFPRMKKLPEAIQQARDTALGIKPKTPDLEKAKPNTIKMKVFTRVPFQSGTISAIRQLDEQQIVSVNIGGSTIEINGSGLTDFTDNLLDIDVVVVGPTTKENFEKIELRTGTIIEATQHPDAQKLLVLKVDLGEAQPRSIVAGIANRFTPEELLHQKVSAVANLKPSKLRGILSQGMLLAAGGDRLQSMVIPSIELPNGTSINIFGNKEHYLLIAQPKNGGISLQSLSEKTIPGSVVR